MLTEAELERSPVVANCRMHRQRGLDSYRRELRFDIAGFLKTGGARGAAPPSAWLDLCCGEGRALDEAAARLPGVRLVGLDLVDFFRPDLAPVVQRFVTPIDAFEPDAKFDLITCVHGLHYVGDKLKAVERALSWLAPDGILLAHLDLQHVRLGNRAAGPKLLRDQGLHYHPRFRLLNARGPKNVRFGWRYLGADDQAGPNFTGQPAVCSYYARE